MRLLLLFVTTFLLITTVWSIKCYDCDSLKDPRCNEYFEPDGVKETDCDEAEMPQYLLKYGRRIPATGCLTKFHKGVDGFRFFVRRACFFGNLEKTSEACEAEDPYLPFADILGCYVCSDDLCNNTNSTGNQHPSFNVILVMILCLVFFSLFNKM